ncbi:hypothetical protein Q5P01_007113 [Channa striata]|uniref:SUEL-type lectin domain-containing protein n=1 Tax=Channa striata TaxID=64152 RepID=A0AA88N648_CHASR|nr:hypothetical protein Q5P01_007113 [Channa striata]
MSVAPPGGGQGSPDWSMAEVPHMQQVNLLIKASNTFILSITTFSVTYRNWTPAPGHEDSAYMSLDPASRDQNQSYAYPQRRKPNDCSTVEQVSPPTPASLSTERAITCDDLDNVQQLSCDSGVISVQAALYGRADNKTCSEGWSPQQLSNTHCAQQGATSVLKERCEGRRACQINTNVLRTSDPCFGIYKYLDTTYTCVAARHSVTCEGSVLNLKCDQGKVLHVYSANYGRNDQTTCSYQRPAGQVQNVQCSRASDLVAQSCNGKNSCAIRASNAVFGDPCGGTYKYLEVAHICFSSRLPANN